MYIQPNYSKIKSIMKWRYLDSLDSTRYSPTEFINQGAPLQTRIEQAAVEIMATILMGNGIVVPNNQLIDSVGFLRNVSIMLKVASQTFGGKSIYVPVLYANYNYPHEDTGGSHLKDPFLLAAHLFGKDGREGRGYFELSAWPYLGTRRTAWADCLRKRPMGIPSHLVSGKLEEQLAEDLLRTLDFFSANSYLIVSAASTKGIREFMTASIANLSLADLENDVFFVAILEADENGDRIAKLLDIIGVFNKLQENDILDNRSLVRENLVKNEDLYFADISGIVEITRIGVLKTFNSIYNFSGYKSTKAVQDNQTEPLYSDSVWGIDEAAFALGRWARENYEAKYTGQRAMLGIVSHQNAFISPSVEGDVINSAEPLANLWESFFDHQQSEVWDTSITSYINSLRLFEKIKQEYDSLSHAEKTRQKLNDLISAAKHYEESRREHVETVGNLLPTGYKIATDEQGKIVLFHYDDKGSIISKIQIENFAEQATMAKIQNGARYASEVDKDTSVKGCTAEYGE